MSPPCPNPRRVAAGRANHQKRRGLTAEGRERLRQAAFANRPWEKATGPRTAEGRARSAANARRRPGGELPRLLAGAGRLAREMAAARRLLSPPGQH